MFLYVHDSVPKKALADTVQRVHAIPGQDLASPTTSSTPSAFDARMRRTGGEDRI
jgi:hypothetical protein